MTGEMGDSPEWDLDNLASQLVHHEWPRSRERGGAWTRIWQIRLAEGPVHEDRIPRIERALAVRGMVASVRVDDRSLAVEITTSEELTSEEQVRSFAMFKIIDSLLGAIEQIEGQPRDEWFPFRGGVTLVNIPTSVDELPEA